MKNLLLIFIIISIIACTKEKDILNQNSPSKQILGHWKELGGLNPNESWTYQITQDSLLRRIRSLEAFTLVDGITDTVIYFSHRSYKGDWKTTSSWKYQIKNDTMYWYSHANKKYIPKCVRFRY